jgi:(p)ppGpp synthase/HD superfamily hydrolase
MFSPGIERALRISIDAHQGQTRKGEADVPYVVHPLHVALILARFGMDEDVLQAAILHDVVEDCDGWTLERLEREFGSHVAKIVAELTEDKSKTWDERKRHGIEKVANMSPQAASVKAADKLHNLQSLLATLRASEDHALVWKHFHGGREKTLKLSGELVEALAARIEPRLAKALRSAMKAVVEQDDLSGRPREAAQP